MTIKKKRIRAKLGPRVIKKKNPFLKNNNGGFDLVEEFPGIDYMPYESKKKRKAKR